MRSRLSTAVDAGLLLFAVAYLIDTARSALGGSVPDLVVALTIAAAFGFVAAAYLNAGKR